MVRSILQFWKSGFNGKAYGGIVIENDFSTHIKDLEKHGCKVVGLMFEKDKVQLIIDKPTMGIINKIGEDSKFRVEE